MGLQRRAHNHVLCRDKSCQNSCLARGVIERSGILTPAQRDACPRLSLRLNVQRRRHDKHLRLKVVRNPHTHPAVSSIRRAANWHHHDEETGTISKLSKVLAASPRTALRVQSSSSVALRKARAQRKAMCCGVLQVAREVHFGKNWSVLVDCAALNQSQCGLRVSARMRVLWRLCSTMDLDLHPLAPPDTSNNIGALRSNT